MTVRTTQEAALEYANRGWRVLPVQAGGKNPVLKDWVHQASNIPERVSAMFSSHTGNIGIATGAASGLVVLDVDLPEGPETLKALEAEFGSLPATLTQCTGGGGKQLFFRYPTGRDIKGSQGAKGRGLGKNVDVRAEGNQVVVPPSIHPNGTAYIWENGLSPADLPPADLPPAWIDRLESKPLPVPQKHPQHIESNGAVNNTVDNLDNIFELPPYVKKALSNKMQELATTAEGMRNATLFKSVANLAGFIASGNLSEVILREKSLEAWKACHPNDCDMAEFEKTFSSAFKTGIQTPRMVPAQKAYTQAAQDGSGERAFLPPPPPVPVDTVFPPPIAALLKEAADAFGTPLEISVACLLALLSCLVGRSRQISVKHGWVEAGNLWIVLVAKSGTGKTPTMKAFFAPVHAREAASKIKYDGEFEAYQLAEQVYQRALKVYVGAQIPQASGKKHLPAVPPQVPHALSNPAILLPPRPQKPRWKQAVADDITPEALGDMLQANTKGVLWLTDEIASLLLNMDRYTKREGGTKSRLLSAHNCGPWKINRSSRSERNIFIPHACIGIFGGIQPGILPTLFRGGSGGVDEESGFVPRILFIRSVAEKPVYFSEQVLSAQSKQTLQSIVNALWDWDMALDVSGNEIERIVPVSDPAKTVYRVWYDAVAEEAHLSAHSAMLKKMQAHALRLCLLLHCLDAALAGNDALSPVTEDTMQHALILADWLRKHQKQCWPLVAPGGKVKQATPLEMAVMQVIVENADSIATNGGRIENPELHKLVWKKPGLSGVSREQVGKTASALQLKACKMGNVRGYAVTPEQIEIFRATVLPVPAVQTQALVANSMDSSDDKLSPSVSIYGFSDDLIASFQQAGIITTQPLSEVIAAMPDNILKGMKDMWEKSWQGFY